MTIRDTTADVRDFPLEFLAASLGTGGPSQAIEEQERAGQAQVLASTMLPTEGSDAPELLELGFTFGPVDEGDPLFRPATLPAGWARSGSDHAMHSFVVDERGIERVNVFYKAAFYDRRADMHVVNVGYSLSTHWIYGDEAKPSLHPQLTADELHDARAAAVRYTEQADQSPDIYGDRLPRAWSLIAAVDAAGGAS